MSPSCSVLADAWPFPYTDFGESHAALGRPILRAAVPVRVPGRRRTFSALADTGGPVTVVAHEVIPHQGTSIVLGQIGFLERFTVSTGSPPAVRGIVGVLSPFSNKGAANCRPPSRTGGVLPAKRSGPKVTAVPFPTDNDVHPPSTSRCCASLSGRGRSEKGHGAADSEPSAADDASDRQRSERVTGIEPA